MLEPPLVGSPRDAGARTDRHTNSTKITAGYLPVRRFKILALKGRLLSGLDLARE